MKLLGRQSLFAATKMSTISSYVVFVTGFVSNVMITRALGPERYGVYSYLMWLAAFLISLSSTGVNLTSIRGIAEQLGLGSDEGARNIRTLSWRYGLGISVFAVVVAVVLGAIFDVYPKEVNQNYWLYIGIVAVCVLAKSSYVVSSSVAKGYSIFGMDTIIVSVNAAFVVTYVVIGVVLGSGVEYYLWCFCGSCIFHVCASIWLLVKTEAGQPGKGVVGADVVSAYRKTLGWNYAFSLASMVTSRSIDNYVLGIYATARYVGFYNLANALMKSALDIMTSGFSAVLLPHISRSYAEQGKVGMSRVFMGSVKFYSICGMLIAGVGMLISVDIVTLIYGSAFKEVVPAFALMSVIGGFCLPMAAYSALFIAADKNRDRLVFMLVSSVSSVAVSFTLIPMYGYEGALASYALGELLSYFITVTLAKRSLDVSFPWRIILSTTSASLLSAGLLWAVRGLLDIPFLGIAFAPVFVLAYLFLLVNIGVIDSEEMELMREKGGSVARWVLKMKLGQS